MARYRSVATTMLAVAVLAFAGLGTVRAQDATPVDSGGAGGAGGAMFADTFGLPELQITLTDAGFEGVPSETAAGMYVISFTHTGSNPSGAAVDFVQLPEGRTVDDVATFAAAVSGPPPGEGDPGMASPESMDGMDMASPDAAMDMASPAAGGEDPFAQFAWIYETYMAGGPGVPQGGTGQGIVDLQPGNYAVFDDYFSAAPPVAMTVTGDAAATPATNVVTADASVTEIGMGGDFFDFEVSGDLQPGQAVIEIVNDSDQPHFMEMTYSPNPITEEQVMQLLMSGEDGPPPEGVDPSALVFGAAYASTQSAGSTQYLAVDLQPGYYILLCFIPDPVAGGIPHAFEGMIQVLPVGVEDAATPTA